MVTGLNDDQGVQNVTAVKVWVNFYPLIDENQSGLTGGANSGPSHHGQQSEVEPFTAVMASVEALVWLWRTNSREIPASGAIFGMH